MTAILSDNSQASILAYSLWQFYNYRLYCIVLTDDCEANRCRIDGIESPERFGTIRVTISLRRDYRQAEGLVHELLHLNQVPFGYPTFWINEVPESEKWNLAAGIINNADHILLEPIYLSFGYSAERFLGRGRPLNDREKCILAHLRSRAAELETPSGYLAEVSTCLRYYEIDFEPMHLAAEIVKQAPHPAL